MRAMPPEHERDATELDYVSDAILFGEPMYDGYDVEVKSCEQSPYGRFNGWLTYYNVTMPSGITHMESIELTEPIAIGVYKSST